jgi:hypothetical protein
VLFSSSSAARLMMCWTRTAAADVADADAGAGPPVSARLSAGNKADTASFIVCRHLSQSGSTRAKSQRPHGKGNELQTHKPSNARISQSSTSSVSAQSPLATAATR